MVNSPSLDATFAALGDPTRRAILARLSAAESCVGDIARPLPISLPAVSRHLRVLESAGLIARRRQGRTHRLRLVAAPLASAQDWISRHRRFWENQLDALDAFLRESTEKEEKPWRHPSRPNGRRRSGSRAPSRPPGRRSSGPGQTRKR